MGNKVEELKISMEIIGKEYRCITPVHGELVNDGECGTYLAKEYIYIYIYDNKNADTYFSEIKDSTVHDVFGKISRKQREKKKNNIRTIFKEGHNKSTIRKYKTSANNQIEMQKYNYDKKEWQLSFVGEILLNGDVIKGRFYNNGKQVVPLRVYYNIDKPLPDPLIPEEEGGIKNNV